MPATFLEAHAPSYSASPEDLALLASVPRPILSALWEAIKALLAEGINNLPEILAVLASVFGPLSPTLVAIITLLAKLIGGIVINPPAT